MAPDRPVALPLLPPLPPQFPPAPEPKLIEDVFRRFPDVQPDVVMEFIREQFPWKMHEFRMLSRGRINNAVDFLANAVQESLELLNVKNQRPELFEKIMARRRLERKADELAAVCRASSGVQRRKLLDELRGTLQEGFDLKQAIMKAELESMQGELQLLEGLISRRQASKDLIIQRRIVDLSGEKDNLKW